MISKPLAVFVAAAAVAGAVVVGTGHMPGTDNGAQPGGHPTSGTPSALRVSHSAIPQQSNGGSGSNSFPVRDQRPTDGRNVGAPGGPTRTRSGTGHRQERAKNGRYVTVFAGSYNGVGVADVKDDKVTIKADVLTADGRAAQFIANNLMFDGPYFSGAGTIMGETVQVSGRLDAARASRLTATFALTDGSAARVVGSLPATVDAGDDNWDEDSASPRVPK